MIASPLLLCHAPVCALLPASSLPPPPWLTTPTVSCLPGDRRQSWRWPHHDHGGIGTSVARQAGVVFHVVPTHSRSHPERLGDKVAWLRCHPPAQARAPAAWARTPARGRGGTFVWGSWEDIPPTQEVSVNWWNSGNYKLKNSLFLIQTCAFDYDKS